MHELRRGRVGGTCRCGSEGRVSKASGAFSFFLPPSFTPETDEEEEEEEEEKRGSRGFL